MASFSPNLRSDPKLSPQQERRFLALHLPRWATDCLKRADPSLASSARPLVLWEKQKGAMRIVALDHLASGNGLFIGQSLSDARAVCPTIEAREIDRGFIEQVFADFTDWHSYASPIVAVLKDHSNFGDLVLDITGASHLFGNEPDMLDRVQDRLTRLGFTVTGAIAPTIGAAWALAHFHPGVIVDSDPREALANLPVVALRLTEAQVDGLNQMGLKQIGQLYGRDRRALTARFGQNLIIRLDQTLGDIEERLVPRLPATDYYAERRFAEPIGLMDDVLMTARDLALKLASQLEGDGLGAQTYHLFLYLTDHKVLTMSVNAARATRDAQHITSLFVHRAERLAGEYDAGFGIDMIRLVASSLSPVAETQIGAFNTNDGAEDLDRLYDRMASRLGPLAVVRSKFVNSHIPEQAIKLEPAVARTPDDLAAAPDPTLKRPLRLLPSPEPITVTLAEVPDGPPPSMVWRRVKYRFVKTSGPERIGAEWWQSPHGLNVAVEMEPRKITVTRGEEKEEKRLELVRLPISSRDYFVAEDDGGRRFWLFREGLYGDVDEPRWYIHGFFA
jgi:protein ImuB